MKEQELAKAVGLTESEWQHFEKVLGRTPTSAEIQMIGVMWSEHCSYKSTKPFLMKIISKGKQVLEGPGENAGLIRFDEKRAIAFKIESHNHPSFVEPFQGAATGVGGILRDIFTMGARPIAVGDYLRFGDLQTSKHQYLLDGVVSGIAHYGNCMGIPTVAGHIRSHPCYNGNILVNVFALGIANQEQIFRSSTARPGQSIMIWGAKTGRDGIHGASLLASSDFQETTTESTEQKIRVQVGDPFKEKCLMEATLECMNNLKEDLMAIQDMGAAGLTCSTMEISYKSGIGMQINLNAVPVREKGMQAFELLLSESQERMLAVVRRGSEERFQKILQKWGCECATIGETHAEPQLRMEFDGKRIVDLPVMDVMDPPAPSLPVPQWSTDLVSTESSVSVPADVKNEWESLKEILSDPAIASKKEIYKRYDSTVGARTVLGPGHDAAVLWVDTESERGVAFKGVSDEDYYAIDPAYGAKSSMVKGIRALACMGAKALAFTDGVNIGNPHHPRVLGALSKMVEGMNEVIQIFETPCVSGNVSMYNQTQSKGQSFDIYPTTFMVMVGKVEKVSRSVPSSFQRVGSEVWLLEIPQDSPQPLPVASLYAQKAWPETEQRVHANTALPFLDLKGEKRLQNALLAAHEKEIFLSCRDVSRGGLGVALAKACLSENPFGFEGDWSKSQQRRDSLLFGESHGRVIAEIQASTRAELMKLGMDFNLQVKRLGTVMAEPVFRIRPLLTGSVEDLLKAWRGTYL